MNNFNYKKATQIINFFAIKEGNQIDKLKAIKLVLLSDRFHLRKFGRFITDDTYFAMKNGTVPSLTLDLIDSNDWTFSDAEISYKNRYIELKDKYNIISLSPLIENEFSKSDLKVMEEMYSTYGQFDKWELSEISHNFPEWLRHKSVLENGEKRRVQIDENDFFLNVSKDVNFPSMSLPEEHLALSKEFYLGR